MPLCRRYGGTPGLPHIWADNVKGEEEKHSSPPWIEAESVPAAMPPARGRALFLQGQTALLPGGDALVHVQNVGKPLFCHGIVRSRRAVARAAIKQDGLVLGQGKYLRIKGRAKKIHVYRARNVPLAKFRRGAHVHDGQALWRVLHKSSSFLDADILGRNLNGHQQKKACKGRNKTTEQPAWCFCIR